MGEEASVLIINIVINIKLIPACLYSWEDGSFYMCTCVYLVQVLRLSCWES